MGLLPCCGTYSCCIGTAVQQLVLPVKGVGWAGCLASAPVAPTVATWAGLLLVLLAGTPAGLRAMSVLRDLGMLHQMANMRNQGGSHSTPLLPPASR